MTTKQLMDALLIAISDQKLPTADLAQFKHFARPEFRRIHVKIEQVASLIRDFTISGHTNAEVLVELDKAKRKFIIIKK